MRQDCYGGRNFPALIDQGQSGALLGGAAELNGFKPADQPVEFPTKLLQSFWWSLSIARRPRDPGIPSPRDPGLPP
jgi:hypothetical protein